MSSEKDASVTSTSQDLLSAALNQSGLMMLDSPASTYSDETESNQDPLSALCLLPPTVDKTVPTSDRKSDSPLTLPQKPTEVKTLPQPCKAPTSNKTIVPTSKPPTRQLITITKKGSKIITVPLSKSDSNVKSNIIRLPLNLNQNGIKTPIIIKTSTNAKPTVHSASSKLLTVGISKPCTTNLLTTTTSISRQPSITSDKGSMSAVKTYARVMVGNKKILIPIIKKNGVNNQGTKVNVATSALKTTAQMVASTVTATTSTNSLVPLPVRSVANAHTTVKRETVSPTLNLGSLFVETAEKEVTKTLNNSVLPIMSNPVYVSSPVPSTVMSDSNNNFGINKKTVAPSITQNIFYNRDCISPLSPVADILSTLTNTCSQSPLAMSSSTTHAQNLISSMAATVATIGGNKVTIKQPPYKKQYSLGKVTGKPVIEDMTRVPAISRSQSVNPSSFYKTPKSKSTKDFTVMDFPDNSNSNRKTTDDLVEEEERVEEEIQHASTYAEYVPSKLNLGLPHPDSVVETSSLSSVPPPDVSYKLNIPEETIDNGSLSALQLEAITYSCQKHKTILPTGERAGFLIGDGAGVGKGRTIAGIIFENYILGRKRALWFSVSNDLKYDAERDLKDIGAKSIHVHIINKFKYGKISSRENGSIKKGVIFATYSSLIAESHFNTKYGTRLKQILQWCGKDFDGVIIFDECHKAKNLIPSGSAKPTKTGYTVLELQKRLPNARVIYASATGASEPRNMAYMSRLGLWGSGTPFLNFMDFIQAVERRGVGAMEMVAMDIKARGAYIARQLSFHGVSFRIHEVTLAKDFIKTYNAAVRLWVAAREAFQTAAGLIDAEHHMKKTMWGQFWATHQRFFKYLCIASKVNHTSQIAREAVKHGKCVVIGLQSTGEARTLDQVEKCAGELDDFVSTARGVFENLIEHHFPAPNRKRVTDLFGKDFYKSGKDSDDKKKENGKRKRKIDTDEEDKQPASKKSHPNKKDSDSSSENEEEEDKLKPYFSDDSLNYSDEDIGKIFGGGSDSDEWGGDSVSGSAKKAREQKKIRKKSSDEDEEADRLLEMAGLKPMSEPTAKEPEAEEKEKSDLANFQTSENAAEISGLFSLNRFDLGPVERAQALKQELLDKLAGISLPNNTLDELIDALGGPENVAEMTGRKGRVVSTDEGNIQYESRSENDVRCDLLNLTEKQRFMDGEKNIAIISEAASSGISLQSDRRARNQRRRLHITLELPWSADRAIQQFGRTHRSNQVNAPEYVFLISELAGEQRFASVVAKRLESLGALTHGDRRATETRDLSQYNFDNKFGRIALESIMKSIAKIDFPLVQPPATYPGLFFKDIRAAMIGVGLISLEGPSNQPQLEKEYNNIVKFMNRILGMEVMQQNAVFQYFSSTLSAIINRAKSQGQFDQGIMDVGNGEEYVERLSCRKFVVKRSGLPNQDVANGYIELHTVKLERGLSWNDAEKIWSQNCSGEHDGFYLTQLKRNGKFMAVLCKEKPKSRKRWVPPEDSSISDVPDAYRLFTLHRPNTGKQIKAENLKTLETRYRRVEPGEAEKWWKKQYDASIDQCSHAYWQGFCNRRVKSMPCSIGRRCRIYHVLSGSVLAVWRLVEKVLSIGTSSLYKMQIVRLKTKDGGKLVGLLIPSNCLSNLIGYLTNPTHVPNNLSFNNPAGNACFAPSFSAMPGSNISSLVRSSSTPLVSNMFDSSVPSGDEEPSDESSFEDVEEEMVDDKFSPDDMMSSVLFPKQKKYSWMT